MILERSAFQSEKRYAEYCGLQSDAKPLDVKDGDEYQEIDTGKKWKYSASLGEWLLQPTSGSGIDTGVESFNGRIGAVVPIAGDYTAEMVGAIDSTEKGAADGVATLDVDGKIPVAQIPALDYDPSGSSQAVQTNLTAHINNTNNPHQTTAEQVGAIAKDGSTVTTASIPFAQGISLESQKVTNMATPTEPTDGANKQYVDDKVPTAATTMEAGLVKQMTSIEDSSGATDAALEAKFNELLAALRTAGMLSE